MVLLSVGKKWRLFLRILIEANKPNRIEGITTTTKDVGIEALFLDAHILIRSAGQ